jgi:hypothetical protein
MIDEGIFTKFNMLSRVCEENKDRYAHVNLCADDIA